MSNQSVFVREFAEVDRLLVRLERNLEDAKLSLKQQETLLGQIKVYGRNPATAGPILTQKGLRILSRYGLDSDSSPSSREALRCIANAFLLNESARQTFVDLGYAPRLAERLKLDSNDEEFLVSRMLFLLTYSTDVSFQALVDKHSLAESINMQVERHAKAISPDMIANSAQNLAAEDAALTETLKLLFNLTYYEPALAACFTPSVPSLIKLILHHPLPEPPLQPPISQLLNALLNLDFNPATTGATAEYESQNPLFPLANAETVVDRLVDILDRTIRVQPEKELEISAAPLCTLIRRVHEFAEPAVRTFMRTRLLPQQHEREKPLGQGDTLPARLLRLSTSPNLPTLRDNVSNLLFELSDKDPSKFVNNIGYGYASGFLVSHGLGVPPATTMTAGEGGQTAAKAVNPFNSITGQELSAEERDRPQVSEMTDEEKEREAERLFVLFERLKATGVVDVKNPVQQAVEKGRFEELSD
ncbi:hypothetical protein BAUCODRAFT_153682 [Baudoinia panamericana UAMH 10762]|uniref:Guanine nucleotide exchange factor synembryn-like protein n=1 Tax=Baudoinia panamericana (strain UAMH 10762) TaxID=717646 RepID=M2NJE2_BAUPA|nr:uncharacterized protein BAUCODRAFT_153682 [Baudoinia panamericana UAMH 10762]EMC99499.1 hypothetical protein BAUCODRAFT_153682 [Baudoinia panamericana UAMH 10762]